VQKLYWREDGTPDFGVPVPDGNTPVRLRSAAGAYARYYTGGGNPTGTAALADTQFRIVSPGLAGGSTVSLESTSNPGMFLRRVSGGQVQFERSSALTSAAARSSASFERRPGLADGGGVSFEASDAGGQYLKLESSGRLVVSGGGDGQATFVLE
jgi:hypothetical protein